MSARVLGVKSFVLVGIVLALFSPPMIRRSEAQSSEVGWTIRPTYAWPATGDTHYELYGPINAIEFQLTIWSDPESSTPLHLASGLFSGLRIVMEGENTLSGQSPVQWSDNAECAAGTAPISTTCPINSELTILPGDSVTATGMIRTSSGQFIAGRYRLVVEFAGAKSRMSEHSARPWRGTFVETATFVIAIRPVVTRDEQVHALEIATGRARVRRDHEEALQLARRLIALAPERKTAHAIAGTSLMNLRRFSEAARELEQAIAPDQTTAAGILLLTYVALGQDTRAEAFARERYGERAVAAAMSGARARLKELQR